MKRLLNTTFKILSSVGSSSLLLQMTVLSSITIWNDFFFIWLITTKRLYYNMKCKLTTWTELMLNYFLTLQLKFLTTFIILSSVGSSSLILQMTALSSITTWNYSFFKWLITTERLYYNIKCKLTTWTELMLDYFLTLQ